MTMTMSDDLTKPPKHGNRPDAAATVRKVSVTLWLDADVLARPAQIGRSGLTLCCARR